MYNDETISMNRFFSFEGKHPNNLRQNVRRKKTSETETASVTCVCDFHQQVAALDSEAVGENLLFSY